MTISQAVQADWAGLVGKPDVLLMRWAIEPSACFGILAEPDGEVASVQLDLDQQLYEQHGEETLTIRETVDLLVAENPEHIVEQLGEPKAGDKASHVIFSIQSGLPDGTYVLDEAGAKKAIRGLYAIGHAVREVERVDLDSGSFGAAQVAYGRTRMIDAGSTISIVEHEGGPNTAAILLPPHDERHIVDLWLVD